MNRRLLTCSILLMIAGMVTLGGVWIYKYASTRLADEYQSFCTDRTQEYLKVYDKWRSLNDEQQEGYLLDSTNFAPSQSFQQTRAEQAARLKANLPDIARNGLKEPLAVAEMLYGPDWLSGVKKYNKLQDIIDGIVATATVSIMLGIIVMLGCILKLCTVSIAAKCKSAPSADDSDDPQPPETKPVKKTNNSLVRPENDDSTPEIVPDEPDENLDYFHKISLVPPKAERLSKLYTTEPVGADSSLVELTQEVTAIRQFASQQQDMVRQLQDGYDWTIIKRFCMRIIRCIDNLDVRIVKLATAGVETNYLQDARDELVFAIESSGVEQIPIQPGSVYKGNEKIAEAVADKELTYDKDLLKKSYPNLYPPNYPFFISYP